MCSCSCKDFIKVGVCCHLVGLSLTHDLNLYDSKYSKPAKELTEKFQILTKRGRKRKGGRSKYGKALDKPESGSEHESEPDPEPEKLCIKKEDENLKSLLLLVKRRLKLPVNQLENNLKKRFYLCILLIIFY